MTGAFAYDINQLAATVLSALRAQGRTMVTAESCTGGLIAAALTGIAGSSDVVERGFISYSNAAKSELLGVPGDLIVSKGAVSREVALAMAEGALAHSPCDIAVSVTGVAGPGGGSADKPVGLVHIAALRRGMAPYHHERRFGDLGRDGIRMASVKVALELVLDANAASDD